jgi:hypothetical protein
LFAHDLIDVGLQLARGKFGAGLDFLAAIPPVRIAVIEDVLRRGIGLSEVRRLFAGFSG